MSAASLVHPRARVGEGCRFGSMAIVEEDSVLGDGCVLEPFARVCAGARLGDRVRLGQGAVVGGAPQHAGWRGERAPCEIGDDVRLGEYATVNGGMFGTTRLGNGTFVMAYAHVGHDAEVGARAILANGVQLAGHVRIGAAANLGGGTLVHQRTRVGELAFVAGGLRLERDAAPWSRIMGEPARWAGVNRVGLQRAGWTDDSVRMAESVLRVVFRSGLSLEAALDRLASMDASEARELAAFCREDGRGLVRPSH